MNENANANKQTKISCCHVNRIDFNILSSTYILVKAKIKENEYILISKKHAQNDIRNKINAWVDSCQSMQIVFRIWRNVDRGVWGLLGLRDCCDFIFYFAIGQVFSPISIIYIAETINSKQANPPTICTSYISSTAPDFPTEQNNTNNITIQ